MFICPPLPPEFITFNENEPRKKRVDVTWGTSRFKIRLMNKLPAWLSCEPSRLSRAHHRLMISLKPALMENNNNVMANFKLERPHGAMKEVCTFMVRIKFNTEAKLDTGECPICFDQFSDVDENKQPVILRCGHSVCDDCLNQLRTSNWIACPVCRCERGASKNEKSLNYTLIGLITQRKQEQEKKRKQVNRTGNPNINIPQILSCHHNPAYRCHDCEACFCTECFNNIHCQRIFSKHSVTYLRPGLVPDPRPAPAHVFIPTHIYIPAPMPIRRVPVEMKDEDGRQPHSSSKSPES